MANEMERVIELIVRLGKIPSIGPDDDLQKAGFSSILWLPLRIELEELFNVTISDDDKFMAARTPRALHELIEELLQ